MYTHTPKKNVHKGRVNNNKFCLWQKQILCWLGIFSRPLLLTYCHFSLSVSFSLFPSFPPTLSLSFSLHPQICLNPTIGDKSTENRKPPLKRGHNKMVTSVSLFHIKWEFFRIFFAVDFNEKSEKSRNNS